MFKDQLDLPFQDKKGEPIKKEAVMDESGFYVEILDELIINEAPAWMTEKEHGKVVAAELSIAFVEWIIIEYGKKTGHRIDSDNHSERAKIINAVVSRLEKLGFDYNGKSIMKLIKKSDPVKESAIKEDALIKEKMGNNGKPCVKPYHEGDDDPIIDPNKDLADD